MFPQMAPRPPMGCMRAFGERPGCEVWAHQPRALPTEAWPVSWAPLSPWLCMTIWDLWLIHAHRRVIRCEVTRSQTEVPERSEVPDRQQPQSKSGSRPDTAITSLPLLFPFSPEAKPHSPPSLHRGWETFPGRAMLSRLLLSPWPDLSHPFIFPVPTRLLLPRRFSPA